MPRSKLPDHLTAIALLVCAVAGCKQIQSLAQPTVLKSADGKFQLTVPAGWREDSSLNDKAEIRAANPQQEMYVVVITEQKADFTDETTLDHYTELTLESMKANLASPDSTPAVPVRINGNPGQQYLIQGAIKNVKLSYLVTTVETTAHFHQIITWTLFSRASKNQTTLQKLTETFRPIPQGGTEVPRP